MKKTSITILDNKSNKILAKNVKPVFEYTRLIEGKLVKFSRFEFELTEIIEKNK